MDHLRKLVDLFQEKHSGIRANDALFKHIEDTLLPYLLRVIRRDNTLLSEVELFPGIKVDWAGTDDQWKKLQMALVYSIFHGDPKEKFGKIMESVKSMIPGGSAQADEVQKLLEDEETQSSMSEMLELIMNTRLVSLVGDVMQSLDIADLGIDLENPEKIMELLRNPQENEALKEIMDRARMILEEKVKSGKINQDELRRDIENIRAKMQSSFGKYLNQAVLGEDAGNTTGNTPQTILSNHPDARRARMLARLQKKQQQKVRDTK